MPVMSTETAGEDQQATAVTIKHESSSSASMHQLLSNSVSAATASSAGGMGGGTIGGIVGSEHSPSPTTLCGGCGFKITDRYYLVAVERAWHSECLRCGECRRPLDTALSCFSRQSRIYCRDDYYRLFGVRRCNRCCLPLGSNELVMRARDAVFHLACFTCAACNQPLTKGDIFGMRDGIVYCRLHYEMLQHPSATLTSSHQSHQHGLLMSHHHPIQGNNNGLIGTPDGPCDLSSCGPHHGLLPPSGFHHPHLMPPESVSPSQHMINFLSSSGVDPAVDSSYPSGLRPSVFGGSVGAGGQDYLHNPSANDFQRCLGGSGSAVSGFFPSLSSSGGLGNGGLGGNSPGSGSLGHHHQHSVQKGRPRKRKIPSAAAAVAAAAALVHSSNNNNNNNNNSNNGGGGSTGNHSDSTILGQQQHLNAANLRQLTAGIDMLGSSADLSSMEGMVYDSSGTNGSASGGGGGGGSSSQQQQQQQRTKRMRTSFKHHQLRTMKSYFAINQNPDAKDLKQLAQKTGLSKRVLQVWFQNARAKWRRNIMRQQDGGGSGGGGGVGGGGGGAGGTSSIKDGDLLTASASSSSSQLEQQQQQHPHHHHQQHQQQQHHQQPQQSHHRVSASLGELTPPGSAGGMTHSSAVSNEDASSNLVFSDLY